jgi:hypothetical protein
MKITRVRIVLAAATVVAVYELMPAAVSAAASGAAGGAADAVTAAVAGESGTLNCRQLETLWEKAGGNPGAAFTAAEIAMAESGGREYATDRNTNGTTDRGYWQVNDGAWGALSTFAPLGNAKAAVSISGNGTNWSPWVTYDSGAYRGRC